MNKKKRTLKGDSARTKTPKTRARKTTKAPRMAAMIGKNMSGARKKKAAAAFQRERTALEERVRDHGTTVVKRGERPSDVKSDYNARFLNFEQYEHVKRAAAATSPAESMNRFIVRAALDRADEVLKMDMAKLMDQPGPVPLSAPFDNRVRQSG